MRYSLSIVYTTARKEPKIEWAFDSLARQLYDNEQLEIIVVDTYADDEKRQHDIRMKFVKAFVAWSEANLEIAVPKPNIWQGESRITSCDWWAKSNAANTGICLSHSQWVCFLDDRSVLAPTWLQSIREAQDVGYAVCGSYEKRANMRVENGEIIDHGTLLGADTRTSGLYPFDSWYGGSGALPLEWCLAVNGFAELTDSLGSEDSMFGLTLRNSGYRVKYDSRMRIIEDRTPGEIDGALKRADKGVSPNDKSHAIVAMFKHATTSQNPFDIRNMRDRVLLGEPFPPPTGSHVDFFDGQPISEMI